MCHQTVALVQRACDRAHLATVSLSVLPEVSERARPSRALVLDHPLGFPLGRPFDRVAHRRVVAAALALLERDDAPFLVTLQDGSPGA